MSRTTVAYICTCECTDSNGSGGMCTVYAGTEEYTCDTLWPGLALVGMICAAALPSVAMWMWG